MDVSGDCADLTGDWYFNSVQNNVDNTLCVLDNQFVVVEDGKTYPTCVQYDASRDTVCDENLICGGSEVTGWPNQAKDAILVALTRADYKHKSCPTIQEECYPLGTYWTDFLTDATVFSADEVANVCASRAGMIRVVQKEQYADTCVGFSDRARDACPVARDYICAGNDNGMVVYGWPGQIVASAGAAFANTAENYRHPQCAGLLN